MNIQNTKPFTIGLTGQSGAGKSYVSKYFEEFGFKILSADEYVKTLYNENNELLQTLVNEFGQDIIKNNILNRKHLANIVFNDKKKLDKLNSIVHPAVIEFCKKDVDGLTVFDAPQLFESNAQSECYKIISVLAPYEVRLQRIINRDGISEVEAKKRINSQLSEEFFISNSDYIIYNNGENVEKQIKEIIGEIL